MGSHCPSLGRWKYWSSSCWVCQTCSTCPSSVYRKLTHTGQYLHFQSHHPSKHKYSVVQTLLYRAKAHSSYGTSWIEEERSITETLRRNGYSPGFIKQCLKKTSRTEISSTSQQPDLRIYIPHIESQSTAIRRILEPSSIVTFFTPVSTLRDLLTHLKDPLPLEEQTGVICFIFLAPIVMNTTSEKWVEAWKQEKKSTKQCCKRWHGEECYCRACMDPWKPNRLDLNKALGTINCTNGPENFWNHGTFIYKTQGWTETKALCNLCIFIW